MFQNAMAYFFAFFLHFFCIFLVFFLRSFFVFLDSFTRSLCVFHVFVMRDAGIKNAGESASIFSICFCDNTDSDMSW